MRLTLAWIPVASALLLAAACSKDDAAAGGAPGGAMPPPEVGVVVARPADVPVTKELVGRLAAFRSADVRARVPGVLQRRLYDEGSLVEKGDVLFRIDPAPLQATLAQAQGALAQAQANAANSRAAAERARGLIGGKFISQADYDNAIAAERTSAAAVQAAKAAVETARINLGYATVRAPISGRAGKQQVTEGALVGQGDATLLTTVEQLDPMYVDFSMSVAELAQVRKAARAAAQPQVRIELPDGSEYGPRGQLDFSGHSVDPATGSVQLRARIANPDGVLLPGTFVTVHADLGTERGVYRVPQDAVQRDPQGAYVLVVGQDGKVARKGVTLERQQGADWVVTDGLASGDRIVVSGIQRAVPGQPAKAVPAGAGAGPAQTGAQPKAGSKTPAPAEG
ncbi:MAG TPA: efflux RND transporter periplasmic adaptor subunit [Xanthomonadaceae bacterium]|jgi:membrane fusion protein (multidrug efflux system)|nr:efflux RND transporter periplasmic adaptor subunit [Xanthomonadaceae bacterium]